MKTIIGISLLMSCTTAFATDTVRGYVKKDGTYVAPHYKSSADNSRLNNYRTQGNVNPYTGKEGTVDPYRQPAPRPTYQQPAQPAPAYAPREYNSYDSKKSYGTNGYKLNDNV